MQLSEVLAVLDALDDAGIRHTLVGGWGVDALVGRQTRDHRDLDIAVDAAQLDASLQVLADLGYHPETDWLPIRIEVAAEGDRWVDVHPVVVGEDGDGVQAGPDGTTYPYPRSELTLGSLDGRLVPCVSAALQRQAHTGYDLRPQDRHDLAVLADVED